MYPYPAYTNYQFQKNKNKNTNNFDQTIENIKNKQYQPSIKTITRTSTKYDENKRQIEIHTDTKTIQTFHNVDNLSLFYNKPVFCKDLKKKNNINELKKNNINELKKKKDKIIKEKKQNTKDEEKVNIVINTEEEKFDFVVI